MNTDVTAIPSTSDLFLKTALYRIVDLSSLSGDDFRKYLADIIIPTSSLETTCVECKTSRIFAQATAFESVSSDHMLRQDLSSFRDDLSTIDWLKTHPPSQTSDQRIDDLQAKIETRTKDLQTTTFGRLSFFSVDFSCTADKEHRILFVFFLDGRSLTKVGQYPSFADLSEPQIEKYRKLLCKEKYKEFARALGLFSHGIGVGSFVYLRRIFETLLDTATQKAIANEDHLNEESFRGVRVNERIKLLKDNLPPFIVQHAQLYSILSAGVHTLSDQDCFRHFPLVRASIEHILDEEIRRKEKDDKVKALEAALGALTSELKAAAP